LSISTAGESKVDKLLKPATPFLAAAERYRSPVTELLGDLIHTPSLSADEADVIDRRRQQTEAM
jgi:hypothetical protein